MSIEIPENMEEVAMQLAQHQVRGEQTDETAIIQNAVRDILQSFFDEALEGHYDDVNWDGDDLVITDFMGKEVGRIHPQSDTFIDDFKTDADSLIERLEDKTTAIVGGR
ncbi:hypothetical protein H5S09_05570 [Limosilactobacillus sp. STM2_1]|uniref:Uncharacterized protein n=1 Tax=Limosilactobacillus rudii TaxID=2759755 RepID=A0A7W3UKW1_9LACO|nr:hypothetical protein [Limosilactobacillus rudii]MBB1079358.1 hypothetical protein [Limosilactobacillus rudii]MBB1097404.1 hypothetical protein [Limosilactobacillus rudii]MCD7134513.1 hypothetical protein [Limosilactobacillus rudii]